MPDQTPTPSPVPAPTSASPAPATQRGPTIHIGDEFGTAKRNLPPIKVLLLALAGVLVVAGIMAFVQRAKPLAAGSLFLICLASTSDISLPSTRLTEPWAPRLH